MSCPEIFYKYTSANTTKIILETGKLRWSSPLLFNDLNEFKRMPEFFPSVEEDWEKFIRTLIDIDCEPEKHDLSKFSDRILFILSTISLLKNITQSKEEIYQDLSISIPIRQDEITGSLRSIVNQLDLETARVLCLTTEFDNEVMWAHYAESHTGCVLGFRKTSNLENPLQEAREINYTKQPASIGTGLGFLLYGNNYELRKKTTNAIFFSKSSGWAYENEWRVLTWRPNEKGCKFGDYVFYPEELESVTFGSRISSYFKSEITRIISNKYPNCYCCEITPINGTLKRDII